MRNRGRAPDLSWDTRTVFWNLPYADSLPKDSNLWMLADDVGLEIWGQFHRCRKNKDTARIEGCSSKLAEILLRAIPHSNGYEKSLVRALGDFGQMASRSMVLDGELNYELCFGRRSDANGAAPEDIMLSYIPKGSVCRIGQDCYQSVPAGKVKGDPEPQFIQLEPKRIARFLPPSSVAQNLTSIRTTLPLIGQSQKSWMEDSIERRSLEPFTDVRRSYDIAVARETRVIGWNGRGMFQEHTADYHFMVRQCRWYKFCIELRDSIVETLGRAFAVAGEAFGEQPRLVLQGLPTVSDVSSAEQKLKAGPTRFDVLFQPFGHGKD